MVCNIMRDKVRTVPGLFNEMFHMSAGYLLGPLQDPAHLAAAEELLPLSGLLAPKQQHVVRGPHLGLHGVTVVFSMIMLVVSLSCLGIEAGDKVGVVLVQPDGGAQVGLRLLRLGVRHPQLELAALLGAGNRKNEQICNYHWSCEKESENKASAGMRF